MTLYRRPNKCPNFWPVFISCNSQCVKTNTFWLSSVNISDFTIFNQTLVARIQLVTRVFYDYFVCTVSLDSYRWKKNGVDFNPSGNDDRVVQLPNQGTIVFSRPEDKDEGIYQCFADNGYGVAASIRVNFREAKLERFAYEERKVYLFVCFKLHIINVSIYWIVYYAGK